MTQAEIVEKCKVGDKKAFALLYSKYAPKMLGVCIRYAKTREEAEDMLQEGFVKLFQKINSFKGSGSFEGWLRRVFVNTAINYYKSQLKYNKTMHVDDNDFSFVKDESDDEVAAVKIPQKKLLEMIQQLPEGYKMVFNLYVLDGYMHHEIAEILNISVNTSKSQLSKARKMLRKKVEKHRLQYSYA